MLLENYSVQVHVVLALSYQYCQHRHSHFNTSVPVGTFTCQGQGKNNTLTSLAGKMVCWCEGGSDSNQGLLPSNSMTISEEESNLFCACHLLNCDEGQGQG
jgi:hypothetical protein